MNPDVAVLEARPLVVFATYAEKPDLTPDDALLLPAFERLGVDTRAVPWDDPRIDWSACDAVLVRSTWDYHHKLPRFLEWTARLEYLGIPLVNPAPLIRWNARKDYLRELEGSGVPVVPTGWVGQGDRRSLRALLEEAGWDQAVVKPVVSASAHETWRTSLGSSMSDEARFRRLAEAGDVMIQPFLAEIEREGEWSLMFLADRFSHAVVKRPKPGDFRVQRQFGGSREVADPDARLLQAARAVLDAAPGRSVYARVDGCVIDGRFVLMELELIEPELFLGSSLEAAGTLAKEVLCRLAWGGGSAPHTGAAGRPEG